MDNDLKIKLLDKVTNSSESALPKNFNQEIRRYLMNGNFSDVTTFIRNLLDKMEINGYCSQFVIGVLELTIKDEPAETEEQALFRRQCAGICGLDEDEQDFTLEITKLDVPRSNPSWPAVSR